MKGKLTVAKKRAHKRHDGHDVDRMVLETPLNFETDCLVVPASPVLIETHNPEQSSPKKRKTTTFRVIKALSPQANDSNVMLGDKHRKDAPWHDPIEDAILSPERHLVKPLAM